MVIGINSLILCLEEPILRDEYSKKTIYSMNYIISWIFIFELLFRAIASGFWVVSSRCLSNCICCNCKKVD